jgi:DNA invertase Pin-like site-specific DNA recombinase
MLKAAMRREFDLIAAWSVDRLGRSLQDLVSFLSEVHAKGINLYLHRQGLDTTTPAGKAMFQVMGVFAEFEREMIRERINAGLARAKERGTKSGRPIGRPRIPKKTLDAIHAARAQDKGIKRIARDLGVGVGTVQKAVHAG